MPAQAGQTQRAGQTRAVSSQIRATASVIHPIGIATFDETTNQQDIPRKIVQSSYVRAPEGRSILIILRVGQQDIRTQRVRSGHIPNISDWRRIITDQAANNPSQIMVTLIDPDV